MDHSRALGLDGRSGDREPQGVDQRSEPVDPSLVSQDDDEQHSEPDEAGINTAALAIGGHGLGYGRLGEFIDALNLCWPVALNPELRARLHDLGVNDAAIRGRHFFDHIQFEAICFRSSSRFEFARDLDDQRGAVAAIIFPCHDEQGRITDLAAWSLDTGTFATWRGIAPLLGAERILEPRIGAPLMVSETALDWLRAGREGLVCIDDSRAAEHLEGHTLGVNGERFRKLLLARLTPHMSRPPRILVQRPAEGSK